MRDVYFCGPAFHLPGEPIHNEEIGSHFQLDGECAKTGASSTSHSR